MKEDPNLRVAAGEETEAAKALEAVVVDTAEVTFGAKEVKDANGAGLAAAAEPAAVVATAVAAIPVVDVAALAWVLKVDTGVVGVAPAMVLPADFIRVSIVELP